MLANLPPSSTPADQILAVDDAGRVLTYGALETVCDEWADKLQGRQLVALLCDNTVPSLSAYIGLQSAGHVVILLSSKVADQALAEIIERYTVNAVVHPDISIQYFHTQQSSLHRELSVCLSTSGSTGSPKLVRFSFEQLKTNAVAIANYLELDQSEVPLAHLPYEYSFGLSVIHSHMAVGAKILLTNQSMMQKQFWENFAQATSFSGVPFHFDMLLRMRLEQKVLPKLKTLTQAGGKLPVEKAKELHSLSEAKGWKFHIMYGQTEAAPRIAWLPHHKMPENFGCIGQPIPGVSLSLEPDGELVVKSPSIMAGYALDRADLAKGSELNGILHTGDLAEQTSSGLYRITGRKSRFIKLQGNRVSLDSVEAAMMEIGQEVYATGVDDKLVMFVASSDVKSIRKIAINLFSFPARSVHVKTLMNVPRMPNDKIDYSGLLRLAIEEGSE